MNPTPLIDPGGTVRAYACGACGHAYSGGQTLGLKKPLDARGIARHAESSRGRAERCCRCITCGAPIPPRVSGDCVPCAAAERERHRWFWFCASWHDVGYLAARGIASTAQVSPLDAEELLNVEPLFLSRRHT